MQAVIAATYDAATKTAHVRIEARGAAADANSALLAVSEASALLTAQRTVLMRHEPSVATQVNFETGADECLAYARFSVAGSIPAEVAT